MRGGWRVSGSATGAVRGPRASLRRPPEACEGRAGGRRNAFLSLFLLFFFSPASKSRKSVSLALGRGAEGRQAAADLT